MQGCSNAGPYAKPQSYK
ncbi:hypothetical protein Golob_018428, partial [Gossypium lobatum]|nr:hypothetical protein [Gossypium lobatum]